MDELDVAWLAGIIEGEGSLTKNKYNSWQLQITMTDKDVIEKISQLVDQKMWKKKKYKETEKQAYKVTLCHKDKLRQLLPRLMPYMGQRRYNRMEECMWSIENLRLTKDDKIWDA